jgi:GAF domain-containing protein/HAMP domain-containing protein/anti-sigma regulatory factor (Ser/Thr protein kinase)
MSDALRAALRAHRSIFGRIGLFGSRARSRDDPASVRGLRGRLFRKYVLLLVGLVSLVLLVNAGLHFWFSYSEEEAATFRFQHEKARSAAHQIEGFIGEIEHQVGWTTAPQWAAAPVEQRQFDFVRLLRQVPAITELIQLDSSGKEQLRVSRLAMDVVGNGKDYSKEQSFIEARQNRVWFSPVYFRKESEPYLTLAMAQAGHNAGVTIAEVNLKLIWDLVSGMKIGEGGYAYVIDRNGRLIAHPDISLVLRDTDLSGLRQVAAARAEILSDQIAPPAMVAKNLSGETVLTAHAAILPLGWTVFVELPLREAMAPLYATAWRNAALLAVAIGLATLAALFLARRMVGPIRLLQAGAARIGAGELDRRIDIHTGDELEELAGGFNRMAGDLQKSYAELEKKVENRTAELKEALDQQTATAEVLGVINSSPGDLSPVFDAMLEKAMHLCQATGGALRSYDGDAFHAVGMRGMPTEFLEATRKIRPDPDSGLGRIEHGEQVVQIGDFTDTNHPRAGTKSWRWMTELGGINTSLWVALRKEATLLGTFVLYRKEVRPFSDKEISLVQNFAAQAVIAMENARLITETREALEQQTATAEVLGVINSSPGDLSPVFDAMLEKATRLCDASFGVLCTYDGTSFWAAALRGVPPAYAEFLTAGPLRPGPGNGLTRVAAGEKVVHVLDLAAEGVYRSGEALRRALVDLGGARSALTVALIRDEALVGAFILYRPEVRQFTDKQIALVKNFAAQAVIAMENARLLTETREALEQQTATAEVLQVINSSPGNLAPVFDAMLEKATRLCDAAFGTLSKIDGDHFQGIAWHNAPPAFAEAMRQPRPILPGNAHYRLLQGEDIVQIEDVTAEDIYRAGNPARRALADLAGARTVVWAALRKDRTLLGAFVIYRQEVRPFSDKQIALLQNFADQAVIAMENARLLTETREALEQQTATAEVLQVINSSPGDLAPVFDAMLDKATRLCEATRGQLAIYDGRMFRFVAAHGASDFVDEQLSRGALPPSFGVTWERIMAGDDFVGIADVADTDLYRAGHEGARRFVELGGGRGLLTVALRKDDILLGALTVYRQEPRPFTDKQIALLQNFAAQAVIAMENARLLTETREALEQQTATSEVLQVINSSPGDLAPVFDAMLERATRLCEAPFGILRIWDGERFQFGAVHGAPRFSDWVRQRGPFRPASDDSLLGRIIAGERVVSFADALVDQGYRTDPGFRRMVEASGIRSGTTVALHKDDALLGTITVYRQEVRPFADKQIALLQNFAAQAVIAMENARLITETREALEQQTATAEVLQVINSSPGDLAPVFDAVLDKAMRLCGAAFGFMTVIDGERSRTVAARGVPAAYAAFRERNPTPATAPISSRVRKGEPFIHTVDLKAERFYAEGDPQRRAVVDLGGARTLLAVPLMRDQAVLGAIQVYRTEVRPFTDKQIALLQNFAAQAVIGMENARLITELRESLEYQTATSDVLRVVSRSTFDLESVLQTVVTTAIRLCRADSATIYRNEGGEYRWSAGHMLVPEYEEIERNVRILPGTGTVVGRAALEGRTVQILDAWTDPLYEAKDDARVGGVHTMIGVPLLREGAPIGVIGLARRRIEAFSEREIQLVTTFADQAVIAMENARLITELRQRTRDLEESLEYQTASGDVLKVISQSGRELEPVLDTLVETAARICRADSGFVFRLQGGLCRMVAAFGIPPEYKEFQERSPIAPSRGTLAGRTVIERRAVHIDDAATDPEYTRAEAVQLGRQRTMLGVPLVREDNLIGVITLARSYVEPFSEKQIGLVTTFADQAVIAIENARLFNELRERTAELGRSVEELRMLNEVAQAVSSTLDLRAVLSTVLTASLGVTWANAGAVFRYSRAERAFALVEAVGWDEVLTRSVSNLSVAETESAMGEAAARRTPIQLPDLAQRPTPLRDVIRAAGFHSALVVPLVGAERILGAIILMRQEAGEFPPETVRLMQTLASQSVLAIQNARLFREIADKSEQLALASQHKSQFLANMSHELRTPLNAILGYAELLVDGIYGQLPERPKGVLERIQNNGKHLLALINDVLDLAKIEAGQLSLTLEDYSLPEVVKSVVTATEPLATAKGLKFTTALQENMPTAHGDARRVAQVLLNLVGNAIKFTDEGEVEIRAAAEKGQFVVTVRDTGPGIPDADQDRIFGEFQQIDDTNTRKKGGTGLGLAISRRMVEMQGGTIAVDSVLGHGSTFRVVLPVHVDEVLEEAAE